MSMLLPLWAALAAAPTVAPPPSAPSPPLSQFETVASPPEAASPMAVDSMRIRSDRFERMTVPVRLGDSGPYRFLVDTGADRTSVSNELAQKLGLEQRATAALHSATGQSQVRMAFVPELLLSRKSVRHIDAPMLAAADIGADGILGIDSLRSHRVLFDFAANMLTIHSTRITKSEIAEGTILVRARRREGRLVITNAKAEGQRVSVVLDTGAELSIGNEALRLKLEQRGQLTPVGPIDLISVTGGALHGELAIVRQIDIGGARIEGLAVVFADAHTFRQLKLDKAPALLLGMNGLRGFDQVSIDFADRKLRFLLPKERKPDPA